MGIIINTHRHYLSMVTLTIRQFIKLNGNVINYLAKGRQTLDLVSKKISLILFFLRGKEEKVFTDSLQVSKSISDLSSYQTLDLVIQLITLSKKEVILSKFQKRTINTTNPALPTTHIE